MMPKYMRFLLAVAVGLALNLLLIGTAQGRLHIVSSGESLSVIAGMYGVTVGQLVDSNDDISNPDVIYPGQSIDIPDGTRSEPLTHEVRPGDTLSEIAVKHGVSMEELQALNDISDPHLIVIGQMLTLPGSASSPPAPAHGLSLADKPVNPEIEAMIEEIAAYGGVDPGLVKALAWVESGWQQQVVSRTGAVGIMQLMPGTVQWLERDIFGYDLYEHDSAYDNITLGVRYLRILLQVTGWNEKVAVGSYYQGHGNTMSGVLFEETIDYIGAIFAVRDAYWP